MTSQAESILAFMRDHWITPLEALEKFKCLRLGARIWELKKAGHPIVSEPFITSTGKHVKRYTLRKLDGDQAVMSI